jgi:hypothetical protein
MDGGGGKRDASAPLCLFQDSSYGRQTQALKSLVLSLKRSIVKVQYRYSGLILGYIHELENAVMLKKTSGKTRSQCARLRLSPSA